MKNYIKKEEVELHYIDSNPQDDKSIPLLICPGLSESAEDYMEVMSALLPRRCITFSHRGRGKSNSPDHGYSLEHHVRDIETFVKQFCLKNFYLMGYSRGVSYALSYAINNADCLKGLILAEYPAEHKEMPKGWAKEYLESYWGDKLGSEIMKPHVVKGIEEDSKYVNFRHELHRINCPTLIMRGVLDESLLSEEQLNVYVEKLNDGMAEVFEKSGHTLKESETEKFITTVRLFLKNID
ncbi:alpha/beta hydrolase [Salipaludibacillus neizhouensis]|uniref:Alpha/beta hydrolase n=1 Tax=Salipaludibacillus neizhouensis TaxID=885475 RepID=A0A3A9K261_9BACI|nr:alpha/beta hydrolase [Salipaludibacillus neizhouensis]RKL67224.1 alpha/beta hydrolase [Salipaludibacillus neizhouensis]